MTWNNFFARPGQQARKSIAGAAIAMLLLTAVPASALVLSRAWTVVNRQTGGAPEAIISGDGTDENPLIVDMGDTRLNGSSSRKKTSTVVLRRSFRVDEGGEQIEFARSFSTDVKNGTILVATTIIPPRGLRVPTFFKTARSTRSFSENRSVSRFLKGGNYTLLVAITYVKKKGSGFWDNSTSGSPHSFSIASI